MLDPSSTTYSAASQDSPTSPDNRTTDAASPTTTSPLLGLSSKRWVILLLFCLYGASNQMQYVAFSTIVREVQDYFSCSSTEVNILAAVFPVVYVVLVIPTCSLYDRIGLRNGLLIGTALNGLGSVMKLLAVWVNVYWILAVAQVLNAFGQVLFLGLPPLLASTWFPDQERTLATALGTLSGFVGMATGMFYSPFVVHDNPDTQHFSQLFGSQCVMGVGVFLGVLLFVDACPPLPPSLTANRGEPSTTDMQAIVRRQLKNKNLLLLITCFGIVNGLFTGLAAVLSQLLQPFGVSEDQTGIIAFVGILSGAANCAVVAPFVDKHRKYKWPSVILFSIVGFLGIITLTLMRVLTENFVVAAFVLIITIEILVLPVIPVVMELSVELTFPDPESVSSGLAVAALSFWSIIGIAVASAILGDTPSKDDAVMLMGIVVGANLAASIGLVFVKEDLLRLQKEKTMVDPVDL